MATITNGNYVTSPIPNTTMLEKLRDGVLYVYEIKAIDGYILHDKNRDWYEYNPETGMESEEVTRGYTTGKASCAASYDFTATTTIDGYTAYGTREFFARPASEVPENQIFGGGGNNDHEIM